jgi:hypothetical protein
VVDVVSFTTDPSAGEMVLPGAPSPAEMVPTAMPLPDDTAANYGETSRAITIPLGDPFGPSSQ